MKSTLLLRLHSLVASKLYVNGNAFLALLALGLCPVILYSLSAKTLLISGRVVDPESGAPVPHAKVVVSAWNYAGLFSDRHPTKFLVMTDDEGRFKLNRELDFIISMSEIEVASPDNRFAAAGADCDLNRVFHHPRPRPGRKHYFYLPGKGYYKLSVYPLPPDDVRRLGLDYASFRGVLGGELCPIEVVKE